MVILELGLLVNVQTVYDKQNNKFNSFVLEKLLEQFCIKFRRDSILSQTLFIMLQPDDSIRQDFIMIKERLPRYDQVKNYLYSQRNIPQSQNREPQTPNLIAEKQSFVENPLARPPTDRIGLPGTQLYGPPGRYSNNSSHLPPNQSPVGNSPGGQGVKTPLSNMSNLPYQLNFDKNDFASPTSELQTQSNDNSMNRPRSQYSSVQLVYPITSKIRSTSHKDQNLQP